MISKMKYANRRWGCNMFYVDSNGGPTDATAPSFFQVLRRRILPRHIQTAAHLECNLCYLEQRLLSHLYLSFVHLSSLLFFPPCRQSPLVSLINAHKIFASSSVSFSLHTSPPPFFFFCFFEQNKILATLPIKT